MVVIVDVVVVVVVISPMLTLLSSSLFHRRKNRQARKRSSRQAGKRKTRKHQRRGTNTPIQPLHRWSCCLTVEHAHTTITPLGLLFHCRADTKAGKGSSRKVDKRKTR